MADQLSATDWLRQGLKTLAQSGFTALKAEPLAKAMGVSRGSFYWHFADIGV
jgi:AcrR family transcriptional regulator